jgi:hypothetical protein
MNFILETPGDPDPHDWLEARDYSNCVQATRLIKSQLVQTATLKPVLEYWIREQVSADFSDTILASFAGTLQTLVDNWIQSLKSKNASDGMSLDDRKSKIAVNFLSIEWARNKWSFKTESIYLDNKKNLDTVTCRLLRVSTKNLALELYHRMKAGEISFETASTDFGVGNEVSTQGLLKECTLSDLPYGLEKIAFKLDDNVISMPMRLGDKFAMVQIVDKKNCILNSHTETLILQKQLDLWVGSVTTLLLNKLR